METGTLIHLLLGGNEGDPSSMLDRAAQAIGQRIGDVQAVSRDHWTAPWGFEDDRPFLNRALRVETCLDPLAVLDEALGIETDLGRVRIPGRRFGPRTIDIDILLYGSDVVEAQGLSVPHPRLHERAFALAPLADIAPLVVHPVLGGTVIGLLNDLRVREQECATVTSLSRD